MPILPRSLGVFLKWELLWLCKWISDHFGGIWMVIMETKRRFVGENYVNWLILDFIRWWNQIYGDSFELWLIRVMRLGFKFKRFDNFDGKIIFQLLIFKFHKFFIFEVLNSQNVNLQVYCLELQIMEFKSISNTKSGKRLNPSN